MKMEEESLFILEGGQAQGDSLKGLKKQNVILKSIRLQR